MSFYFTFSVLFCIFASFPQNGQSVLSTPKLGRCGVDWKFEKWVSSPEKFNHLYPPLSPEKRNEGIQPYEEFFRKTTNEHRSVRGSPEINLIFNSSFDDPKVAPIKEICEKVAAFYESVLDENFKLDLAIQLVYDDIDFLGATGTPLLLLPWSIVQYGRSQPSLNKYEVWKNLKNTPKMHDLFNMPENLIWNDQILINPSEMLLIWGRSTYELYGFDENPITIFINTRFAPYLDMNTDDPTSIFEYDMFSVLLHEFGHVLGFGSGLEDIDTFKYSLNESGPIGVYSFDIFRFMDPKITDLRNGVRQADPAEIDHYFGDGENQIPLSRGTVSGESQAGHWLPFEDVVSDSNSTIKTKTSGLMDPYLISGEQFGFSAYDFSAFSVLGYHFKEPIVPFLQTFNISKDLDSVKIFGLMIENTNKVYCRFNKNSSTSMQLDERVKKNFWRYISCPIPQELRVKGSKLTVQLSNDKGKNWSNALSFKLYPDPILKEVKLKQDKGKIVLKGKGFKNKSYCQFPYNIKILGEVKKDGKKLVCPFDDSLIFPEFSGVRVWQNNQFSEWMEVFYANSTTTPPDTPTE